MSLPFCPLFLLDYGNDRKGPCPISNQGTPTHFKSQRSTLANAFTSSSSSPSSFFFHNPTPFTLLAFLVFFLFYFLPSSFTAPPPSLLSLLLLSSLAMFSHVFSILHPPFLLCLFPLLLLYLPHFSCTCPLPPLTLHLLSPPSSLLSCSSLVFLTNILKSL